MSPAAHIARNRALLADAERLKLTPAQTGGLWAQMASDYEDMGAFADSETAYNRALGLLGPESSTQVAYAVTLNNLGSLYTMTGRYDAAENCNRHSLSVVERLGDPLMIARAQGHLADVYLAMGRNKDALHYSSLAVRGVSALPAATNEDRGSLLISYAYASCLTAHCNDGLEAAQEAMRIVRTAFPPDSFAAGQTHVALGYVEGKIGADTAADDDLREGIRVLRMQLPPSHPLMMYALGIYRDFLKSSHRDVEAKRIAEEQKAARDSRCSQCTVSVYGLRAK